MKNKKTDWRDEALQMPLSDLLNIYNNTKKKRFCITTIPIYLSIIILFIYGIEGWASFAVFMYFHTFISIAGAWDFIIIILCCSVIIMYPKKSGNNIALILFTAYILFEYIFTKQISSVNALTLIYILAVRKPIANIDRDLEFLKSMPTFPFNERVSSQMINVANYKKKIQIIENSKGNIYSENAERIFDMPLPEPPKYEKGDTPEDYFQRKKTYIDGKMMVSSLSDEEYDRQEDELYSHHIYRDKRKKAEGLPIAPGEIQDDGRLQEFDFTSYMPPPDDDLTVPEDLRLEEIDFTEDIKQE